MCNPFRLHTSISISKNETGHDFSNLYFFRCKSDLEKKKPGNLDYCRNNWINDVTLEIVFFLIMKINFVLCRQTYLMIKPGY